MKRENLKQRNRDELNANIYNKNAFPSSDGSSGGGVAADAVPTLFTIKATFRFTSILFILKN